MRFHSEQNLRNTSTVTNGLGLTGNDNDFLLQHTRLYLNAEYSSQLHFFGEMVDAVSDFEKNALPWSIEENRADIINLYAEIRG